MADNTVDRQDRLRAIPKVDQFLDWIGADSAAPRLIVKNTVRDLLALKRQEILTDQPLATGALTREVLLAEFNTLLKERLRPNFRRVINGTGVVVHTNLGRSLLPASAMAMINEVGGSYANLEFDLKTGKRGSRYSLVEKLLCELTGAESALVVNNNAAAVLLVLDSLAKGREVIVSRGQLVEIGGSFRIPEVMEKSGARLVEVGATNRTHLKDYEQHITAETALILKVHTSNYRMIGFTKEVGPADLAALGAKHGITVMEDLGSGSFVDFSRFGLEKESTVMEVLKAGVDVVTFSGDKLLGGPQAGIILGKRQIIQQIKQNPLNRALRIDKFTLAGLEATIRLYFDEARALAEIPTLRLLTQPFAVIRKRAQGILRRLRKALGKTCDLTIVEVESRVGGGALPEQGLRSCAVALQPVGRSINQFESELRRLDVPVIGRIEDDRLLLDVRTIADDEVVLLVKSLTELWA